MLVDVKLTGTGTKNEHIVTVKMDGVGQGEWLTGTLLDDPVSPLCRFRNVNEVVVHGEVIILLGQVLEGGLGGVDDHASSVDSPEDDRLIGNNSGIVEGNRQALGLQGESVLGNVPWDLRNSPGVLACGRNTIKRLSRRVSNGLVVVGEDRAADTIVKADTGSVGFSTEPEVRS